MEKTANMPRRLPLDVSKMTEEQFNAEIQKGYDDILAGKGTPAEEVWEEMQRYMKRGMEC